MGKRFVCTSSCEFYNKFWTLSFSKYLDGKQEALLDNAYTEIYAQVLGKQCTNRGDVTVKFNAPNYRQFIKKTFYICIKQNEWKWLC